jgi:hypothetical protein
MRDTRVDFIHELGKKADLHVTWLLSDEMEFFSYKEWSDGVRRAMLTTVIKRLFVVLLVLTALTGQGQLYSVSAGGTIMYRLDHTWVIGPPPNCFGLVQYRERNCSSDPLITYTTVHFGSYQFTVQMPALSFAGIGVVALSSIVLLAITVKTRTWRHQTHAARPVRTEQSVTK